MVVDTPAGIGARKSAPPPGQLSVLITAISASRVSTRYRSRVRVSQGRSMEAACGLASRRSAWVSSHSGEIANRLVVRSSLPTSIRSVTA
jgi:hypothetical protein